MIQQKKIVFCILNPDLNTGRSQEAEGHSLVTSRNWNVLVEVQAFFVVSMVHPMA